MKPVIQDKCCRHESRLQCRIAEDSCRQGYKSHALPDGGDECECGRIVLTTEAWKNCSGLTHVFQVGMDRCGCRKRFAGEEAVK